MKDIVSLKDLSVGDIVIVYNNFLLETTIGYVLEAIINESDIKFIKIKWFPTNEITEDYGRTTYFKNSVLQKRKTLDKSID